MQRRVTGGTDGPRPPGESSYVLLVEDDPFAADVIEDLLAEIGYGDIVRAATVDEALDRLQQRAPALAVLDANLRGVPAHAVASALKAGGVPFIVSTGYDPTKLPPPFQHGPPLKKPYGRDALAAALAEAVARTRR